MSTLQHIQNLHPSQQATNSDKNKIHNALVSPTDRGAILLSHGALIILEFSAMRQATKEPPITHERLRRINGDRREKVNHKLESLQLSRKEQVSISGLRSGHHPDLKYCLHKICRALDTVCRKCSMVEETVEHVMGECPRIHHPTAQLNELYLIATNPIKALELWELW